MEYSQDDQFLLESEDNTGPDDSKDVDPTTKRRHDNEQQEDDDGFDFSAWTLRKCSASALDSISELFRDELLPILIPLLQEKMKVADHWAKQECIILAIGAVAKGCYRGMKDYIIHFMPFFFDRLNNSEVS